MLAKYFAIVRNYVLSVSSQRKYNFCHQNTLLDAFRTNSRNIIGSNPSMVIPSLGNQDLTPMLFQLQIRTHGIQMLRALLTQPFASYAGAPNITLNTLVIMKFLSVIGKK